MSKEDGTTTNYKPRVVKMANTTWKRRITFYDLITRMSPEKLTNRIFAYFINKKAKGPVVNRGRSGDRMGRHLGT